MYKTFKKLRLTKYLQTAAHTAAERDAALGRDARIAYSDQAATDAMTIGVVKESPVYQDATANGNVRAKYAVHISAASASRPNLRRIQI